MSDRPNNEEPIMAELVESSGSVPSSPFSDMDSMDASASLTRKPNKWYQLSIAKLLSTVLVIGSVITVVPAYQSMFRANRESRKADERTQFAAQEAVRDYLLDIRALESNHVVDKVVVDREYASVYFDGRDKPTKFPLRELRSVPNRTFFTKGKKADKQIALSVGGNAHSVPIEVTSGNVYLHVDGFRAVPLPSERLSGETNINPPQQINIDAGVTGHIDLDRTLAAHVYVKQPMTKEQLDTHTNDFQEAMANNIANDIIKSASLDQLKKWHAEGETTKLDQLISEKLGPSNLDRKLDDYAPESVTAAPGLRIITSPGKDNVVDTDNKVFIPVGGEELDYTKHLLDSSRAIEPQRVKNQVLKALPASIKAAEKFAQDLQAYEEQLAKLPPKEQELFREKMRFAEESRKDSIRQDEIWEMGGVERLAEGIGGDPATDLLKIADSSLEIITERLRILSEKSEEQQKKFKNSTEEQAPKSDVEKIDKIQAEQPEQGKAPRR